MYSNRIALALVLSFHLQRPGVPGFTGSTVVRELRVLLAAFEQYPELKLSCYFDGFLLDTLKQGERSILTSIQTLVRNGRLELISGLYYEPELSLASSEDLARQLDYARQFWSEYEGVNPHGFRTKDFVSADILDAALEAGFSYLLTPANVLSTNESNPVFMEPLRCSEADITILSEPRGLPRCSAEALCTELRNELTTETARALIPASLSSRLGIGRYYEGQATAWGCFEEFLSLLTKGGEFELVLLTEGLSRSVTEQISRTDLLPVPQCGADPQYSMRAADIRRQLVKLPNYVETNPLFYVNSERLELAIRRYQQSLHRPPVNDFTPRENEAINREAVSYLVAAQVEIDAIHHAEIDPSDGWVERSVIDFDSDGHAEELIDTPFARYCFKPSEGGRLMLFEYKPRRIHLAGNLGAALPSFTAALVNTSIPDSSSSAALPFGALPSVASSPRKNPGMVVQRIIEPLHLPNADMKVELYKDFVFHAGVGGHLNQATTGFSLEYWLETETNLAEETYLVLDTGLSLPSLSAELLSARALLCVGGSSEKAYPLAESQTITAQVAPGGVYGVRLIDGVKNFVIDLRSARQLSWAALSPVMEDGICLAISVRLAIPARLVQGDDSPNTLFLSIA